MLDAITTRSRYYMIDPAYPLPDSPRLLLLGWPVITALIAAAAAKDARHALGVVRELRALHLLFIAFESLFVQLLHVGLRLRDEVLLYNGRVRRSSVMTGPLLAIRDFQRIQRHVVQSDTSIAVFSDRW